MKSPRPLYALLLSICFFTLGLTLGQASVSDWKSQKFEEGELSNRGVSGDLSDPNHNGISNLLEYAFNGEPKGKSTGMGILPAISVNRSNRLQAVFNRYLDRDDLTIVVQGTDNPTGTWTDLASSVNGGDLTVVTPGVTIQETGSGNVRTVEVTDLYPVTDPQHASRFMRMKVSGEKESATVNARPEVWLAPPFLSGETILDLLSSDKPWDFTKNKITGLKLYIDMFRRVTPEDLTRLAQFVQKNNLKIIVELGGTLNPDWGDQAGANSAEFELSKLALWSRAGGRIDYIDIDGPERRLLGYDSMGLDPSKRFVSIERCGQQLAIYMKAVLKVYPDVKFFLLTNFPNWGYKGDLSYHGRGPQRQDYGDYADVVKVMLETIKSAGLSFESATVDHPYEYAIGTFPSATLANPASVNWIARIRDYEDYTRSQNMGFNLIINSEFGGEISDQEFYERTLQMYHLYTNAGGRPNRYFIQSWYHYPKTIVPETTPFSMTALAKALILELEKKVTRSSAGISSEVHSISHVPSLQ